MIDIGSKHGKWQVIGPGNKPYSVECQCECGTVRYVKTYNLSGGASKSCGRCLLKIQPGQEFFYLTALECVGKDKHSNDLWRFRCRCGRVTETLAYRVIAGHTKSCKCYQRQQASKAQTTHGESRKGVVTVRLSMFHAARYRAKKREIPFNIKLTDVIIPERCPLLGIPLIDNRGGRKVSPESPTLDRIDSSKGYIQGNVMVISHKANTMKSNATVEELETLVKNLKEYYGKQ